MVAEGLILTYEQKLRRQIDKDLRRPDISIFRNTNAAKEVFSANVTKSKAAAARIPWMARTAYSHTAVFMEVKTEAAAAAFRVEDPSQGGLSLAKYVDTAQCNLLNNGLEAQATRGQITEYATEISRTQHRLFTFGIYVYRDTVRFIRYDRAGATVSEVINYRENPEDFMQFLYRLGHLTPIQLGYDPSAVLATDDEVAKMKAFIDSPSIRTFERQYLQNATADPNFSPIYKLEVAAPTESDPARKRHFLVGKAETFSRSPVGRGTRGYIAFDLEEGRLHWLKDVWRADSAQIHKEIDVYKRLHNAGVPNIASIECGGDVETGGEVQTTRSQDHFPEHALVLLRIHYRLVFKNVYRPLNTYGSARSMIIYVGDALEGDVAIYDLFILATHARCIYTAHYAAWTKAKILHRDISEGNIMIDGDIDDPHAKGVLNDWDLCKYEEDLVTNGATQKSRSVQVLFTAHIHSLISSNRALGLFYPLCRYVTPSNHISSRTTSSLSSI